MFLAHFASINYSGVIVCQVRIGARVIFCQISLVLSYLIECSLDRKDCYRKIISYLFTYD